MLPSRFRPARPGHNSSGMALLITTRRAMKTGHAGIALTKSITSMKSSSYTMNLDDAMSFSKKSDSSLKYKPPCEAAIFLLNYLTAITARRPRTATGRSASPRNRPAVGASAPVSRPIRSQPDRCPTLYGTTAPISDGIKLFSISKNDLSISTNRKNTVPRRRSRLVTTRLTSRGSMSPSTASRTLRC